MYEQAKISFDISEYILEKNKCVTFLFILFMTHLRAYDERCFSIQIHNTKVETNLTNATLQYIIQIIFFSYYQAAYFLS